MTDESQSKFMANFDLVLKVLSGVLIPLTIVIAGHMISAQQQRESDASLKQQQESDLAQRNADRAANLLHALASDNARERQLTVRVIEHLIKANQFPAELGPALITVSLTDPDPEVARVASEALPRAFSSNPELERAAVTETQRILKNNGYYNGALDGTNNDATREALRRFQQENGIETDGAVRPGTLQKLRDAQQRRQPPPTDAQSPTTPAARQRPPAVTGPGRRRG